ncbi:hypothetical protein D3C72_1994470 [compost metagenome]
MAFWISTLEPEFWIAVGIPAEFAKAPSAMLFAPDKMLTAALSATVPCRRMSFTVTSAPPRMSSSLDTGTAFATLPNKVVVLAATGCVVLAAGSWALPAAARAAAMAASSPGGSA